MACLFRQFREVDAAFGQGSYDFATLFGVGPSRAEIGGGWSNRAYTFGSVIGIPNDTELFAVGVQLVDEVGNNLDLASVEIELAWLACGRLNDDRIAIGLLIFAPGRR